MEWNNDETVVLIEKNPLEAAAASTMFSVILLVQETVMKTKNLHQVSCTSFLSVCHQYKFNVHE